MTDQRAKRRQRRNCIYFQNTKDNLTTILSRQTVTALLSLFQSRTGVSKTAISNFSGSSPVECHTPKLTKRKIRQRDRAVVQEEEHKRATIARRRITEILTTLRCSYLNSYEVHYASSQKDERSKTHPRRGVLLVEVRSCGRLAF